MPPRAPKKPHVDDAMDGIPPVPADLAVELRKQAAADADSNDVDEPLFDELDDDELGDEFDDLDDEIEDDELEDDYDDELDELEEEDEIDEESFEDGDEDEEDDDRW